MREHNIGDAVAMIRPCGRLARWARRPTREAAPRSGPHGYARGGGAGLTLVEMVVALAILGILSSAIAVGIVGHVRSSQVGRAIQEVAVLEKGAASFLQSQAQSDFTNISIASMVTAGVVPNPPAGWATPWAGGTYAVACSGTAGCNGFQIQLSNVPAWAQTGLTNAFGNRASVSGNATLTIDYNRG